jgi:hypothetical protein
VPAVEEQAAEHLVLEVPQARDQVLPCRARAGQRRARPQPLEVMAAHELERGLQFCPARRPDARLVAERVTACRQQAAQGAEAAEQRAREVERIHPGRAVPQPDREQLRLGQRARAESQEFLARPLGGRPVPDVHAPSLAERGGDCLMQIAPVPG